MYILSKHPIIPLFPSIINCFRDDALQQCTSPPFTAMLDDPTKLIMPFSGIVLNLKPTENDLPDSSQLIPTKK